MSGKSRKKRSRILGRKRRTLKGNRTFRRRTMKGNRTFRRKHTSGGNKKFKSKFLKMFRILPKDEAECHEVCKNSYKKSRNSLSSFDDNPASIARPSRVQSARSARFASTASLAANGEPALPLAARAAQALEERTAPPPRRGLDRIFGRAHRRIAPTIG